MSLFAVLQRKELQWSSLLLTRAVAIVLAMESEIYQRVWRDHGYGKNSSNICFLCYLNFSYVTPKFNTKAAGVILTQNMCLKTSQKDTLHWGTSDEKFGLTCICIKVLLFFIQRETIPELI